MDACAGQHLDVATFLVNVAHANAQWQNEVGQTAMDIAKATGMGSYSTSRYIGLDQKTYLPRIASVFSADSE